MDVRSLPVAQMPVAAENPFSLHLLGAPPTLVDSVARYGVLNPVRVQVATDGISPVCGFRRIDAARRAGVETLAAVVLPPLSTEERLRLALEDNLHPPTLGQVDGAIALERFQSLAGYSLDRLASDVAPLLGLPTGREALKKHLAAVPLLLQHRGALAAGTLKAAHLLAVALDPAPVRDLCVGLFLRGNVSVSAARRVRTLVFDLLLVEGMEGEALREALDGVSSRDLLARLEQMRYPELAAREDRYQRALARAGLPDAVTATHGERFEGGSLSFTVRARRAADLAAAARRLASLGDAAEGEALFRAGLPFSEPPE